MGWTFSFFSSRSDLIHKRSQSVTQSDGSRWVCLRHTTVGNVLWTVWEVTPGPPVPPRASKPPYRYIGCDLLASGGEHSGWGYKDLCESMGPVELSCPLSYLDMVPVANAGWREAVQAWHAARKRHVDIGDVLILEGFAIPQVKIVAKQGRRLTGEYQGRFYRVTPRVLARVAEQCKAA